MHSHPDPSSSGPDTASPAFYTSAPPVHWWRTWWRSLSPTRQDRLAALAPMAAVALFLTAILVAFWYLRAEEVDREQEALRRDVEYAQQRLRLRLLERQEQVMRLARDAANADIGPTEFGNRAEVLITQYPELQELSWATPAGKILATHAAPTVASEQLRQVGEALDTGETAETFRTVRLQLQPVYLQPHREAGEQLAPMLQLQVPLNSSGEFGGVVLAEFSVDSLLRYGIPTEVLARYALSLRDDRGKLLAGTPLQAPAHPVNWMGLRPKANQYEVAVGPVGNALVLHAQAYRASLGMVGSALFWLVGTLSVMTAWLLLATWRHTRKRMRTQEALVAETNFRRAMENSVLTGMRALDLQGRITYVNAAFCQMTGWNEQELVGQLPPYPYWPDTDYDTLRAKLHDELSGKTIHGGFQVRVRRKNSTHFDARLYVSPLIDAHGQHTGWMSSMTDITEPNRIRDQLAASHERFTVVLEALDASVSVAPLGSTELLFANKLYRQWFGSEADGHLRLVEQAGVPSAHSRNHSTMDDEDGLMGLPTEELTSSSTGNAEIYVTELGKWLEVRSRYLSWVDGRLAQMVIATDITPRRLAEEQNARQAERAQSVSRLITMGEMASSVAHELNQPLTAISNYSSGMLTRLANGSLTEDQMKFALEKTAHQAQRAGQIIQRIRSFVKRSEPNRMLANVNDMVEEAVELADIELRRRNVRLSHHIAARLPQVMADRILIEQVLVNLMKNGAESVDLSNRSSGNRSVELQVRPNMQDGKQGVEFAVLDSGKGLPPEVLERLFEAFFTTKSEGMGMGLNLCRSIVESHHGRMQAQNLYNGSEVTGCRFSFWLPLAHPKDSETSPPQANNPNPRTPV
ncbi:PAS domain S-box protein [Comamonas sp. GB3 AK4-5]|uniref:PAS domain-containing sensor histidine kinase n=1 Tax=Comamonas sp. GB3 AK4-5 TaxID=3231487 RepID=UPI00351E8EB7